MKALLVTLAVAFVGLTASITAQDDPRFAALERRIATLELQNQTLRLALENLAGKPIQQIAFSGSAGPSAPTPPAPAAPVQSSPMPSPPTPEQQAAMDLVRRQIAELEGSTKRDPFADPPRPKSKLRISAADRANQEEAKKREIDRLKDQLAAMEAALSR